MAIWVCWKKGSNIHAAIEELSAKSEVRHGVCVKVYEPLERWKEASFDNIGRRIRAKNTVVAHGAIGEALGHEVAVCPEGHVDGATEGAGTVLDGSEFEAGRPSWQKTRLHNGDGRVTPKCRVIARTPIGEVLE